MSEVKVTLETVKRLSPIEGADQLEVADIAGYPVVVRKGSVVEGGEVVYFPPEIQIPRFVSNTLGVDNYLRKDGTVVKAIRLRGQVSHGMALAITDFPILAESNKLYPGQDLSEFFGARRYVQPPKFQVGQGQERNEDPYLYRYTDIDRYEKMVQAFQFGEQVYAHEKVHGANVRIAMINGELMVGSRKTQRKMPDDLSVFTDAEGNGDPFKDNMYWFPLSIPGVMTFLEEFGNTYKQVILFGEVFGKGVQGSFDYGRDSLDFRAFDIMLDGQYLNPPAFESFTRNHGIPTVPLDYSGAFDPELIAVHVAAKSQLTKKHIREGIVIKPLNERNDHRHGRVIAKWLNPNYLIARSAEKVEDNAEV